MKEPIKLSPFKHLCMTIGNLPSSYVDSMSYYECLLWLINYLQKTVIPALNNNAEAVKEIQEWIKNLDLQDEVDKKLDEMAKSGELQEIISEYLNSTAIFGFNNVNEMKSGNNLISGSYTKTLGYYEANDGGGSLYKIREIKNTDIVDGTKLIALNNNNLVAELIITNDTLNIKQFGAYGDLEHNDTEVIQKAFNSGYGTILFTDGNYKVTDTIYIQSNTIIKGTEKSTIYYVGDGVDKKLFRIYGINNEEIKENIVIDGLNIDGTYQVYKGGNSSTNKETTSPNAYARGLVVFYTTYARNITIKNCVLNDLYGDGIVFCYSSNVRVDNNSLYSVGGSNALGADNFGDGIVGFACYNIIVTNNTVINKRTYLTHEENSVNQDCYGKNAGRSGLEFEFDLVHNVFGIENFSSINYCVDYDLATDDNNMQNAIFENNYVYGYNKGLHIENGVSAIIKNNTFIHNHIGILQSHKCNGSIIDGNYINNDNCGASIEIPYNQNYCCIFLIDGAVQTRLFGKNCINNKLFGDSDGIHLTGFEGTISNNEFRCSGKPISVYQLNIMPGNFGSEKLVISSNYFDLLNNPIDLSYCGSVQFIGNTITAENTGTTKVGITMLGVNTMMFANNCFKNISIAMNSSNWDSDITINNNEFINSRITGTKVVRIKIDNNIMIVSDDNLYPDDNCIVNLSTNIQGVYCSNNVLRLLDTTHYIRAILIGGNTQSVIFRNNQIICGKDGFVGLQCGANLNGALVVSENEFNNTQIVANIGWAGNNITTTFKNITYNNGIVNVAGTPQ